MKPPDRARMEQAVAQFLDAMGLDRRDPNLKATPKRVAEAWLEQFIDGYQRTPARELKERFPAGKAGRRQLVVVTRLRFHSMCPHHLLPYTGWASVAYLPGREVVGFGRLSAIFTGSTPVCFTAHSWQASLSRSSCSAVCPLSG